MTEKEIPCFYAILTADVRYDKTLPPNAKLLFAEITALCQKDGRCWASNKYFADLYGVSVVSVSKWISALVSAGYVKTEISYKENSREIAFRYITPIKEKFNTPLRKVKGGIKEKFKGGIKEKFKDNNTSINNTSINNKTYSIDGDFESDFLAFWNAYDKKVGDKVKIAAKWKRLTNSDREAIMQYIPRYIQSQPNKKYRKNPETFLNNKSWNDEIIADGNSDRQAILKF